MAHGLGEARGIHTTGAGMIRATYRTFTACAILLLAYALAGADRPAANAPPNFPTETLTSGTVSAVVCIPDAANGFYKGTRFDHGSMILSFASGDTETFRMWKHPTTHPEINGGAGPCEEFDFGLDGVTVPSGYNEAKPGEPFLKIGVGWLKKKDDKPYMPFFPFEVVDTGVWKSERVDASSIRIVHSTDSSKRLAYRLSRTITVSETPARLSIQRELVNTGTAPLNLSHYCHNFIQLRGMSVGPACRVTLPFPAAFDGTAPEGWKLSTDVLSFEGAPKGAIGVKIAGVKTGETPNFFTVANMTSATLLRCVGDRPLSGFTVFADATTICPEPFITLSIAPGESAKWSTTYEIGIPAFSTNKDAQ